MGGTAPDPAHPWSGRWWFHISNTRSTSFAIRLPYFFGHIAVWPDRGIPLHTKDGPDVSARVVVFPKRFTKQAASIL